LLITVDAPHRDRDSLTVRESDLSPFMDVTSKFEKLAGEEDQRTDFVRYAIAIVAVVAAALAWWGARLVVIPEVLSVITVAIFTAAVLGAAWIAGTGPGFAATAFGTMTLLFLLSGPQHVFSLLAPRDTAVIIASTALSALITMVVGRLRASSAALMRGLPDIERQARNRATEAAERRVDEERRLAAAAKADVADMQRILQQWKSAAATAVAARAEYLAATRLAVRLPLCAIQRYAARIRTAARGSLPPLQDRTVDGIAMCEKHIATLVDTVLAPACVETGQLVPRIADVSLSDVAAQASALVEPLLAADGSTVEFGSLDVPHVRADAAILTQALARLLNEALTARARPCVLRLEAQESGDGVTLECHELSNESLTVAPDGELVEGEGEDMQGAVWSSLAAAEQLSRMGGVVTTGGIPGTESRFTVWLSTQPANDLKDASAPVILWPPVAFELPRSGRSAIRQAPGSR
jgi:K+-sensing histidine kinase KdpD